MLEPIGQWTNRAAGRLGVESFYPMSLTDEIIKCARIVGTFARTGAATDAQGKALPLPDKGAEGSDARAAAAAATEKTAEKTRHRIPPAVMKNAKGVAVFTVCRMGFGGFSGASGSGVVLSRNEKGDWGTPSGILVHTFGWGLLFGADVYDVVLVLRNQRAVDAFKNPKFSIGGELSVAAGPIGEGGMYDTGVEAAPSYSYIKSKGFYIGAQLGLCGC